MAHFANFGYQNLIKSASDYGFADGSSFMATGGTLGAPGVPEPATWALMLIGVGGIGAMARRRSVKTALAA